MFDKPSPAGAMPRGRESLSEIEIEYRQYSRLSAEFDRLFYLQDEREKAYNEQLPKRPDALRWTRADTPLGWMAAVEDGEKNLFIQCEGEGRRALEIVRRTYSPKMKKRANEVLSSYAAWRHQCKKLRKEIGLEQVEKDLAKIEERYSASRDRIRALPVRSLRDAAFKGLVLSIVVADDRAERFFFELAAVCGIPRLPETEGLGEAPEGHVAEPLEETASIEAVH